MLPHRTFESIWEAPLWGGPLERGLAALLILSAIAGCMILHQTQRRPAARLLGCGAAMLLGLAILGISWEPLGYMGTAGLLLPALWFAALPAALAWTWGLGQLRHAGAFGAVLAIGLVGAVAALAWLHQETALALTQRMLNTRPLALGLDAERETLIEQVKLHTSADARILWEDRRRPRQASHWQALLPLWTSRPLVGGLDGDGLIEHSTIGLRDGQLAGRPIASWSADALDAYCKRYNIGWIACWTEQAIERLNDWDAAEKIAPLRDDGVYGWLFAVKHAPRSYTLKGKAELVHADSKHITLSGLEPDQGVVVLSLHYQTGLRASPSRVHIEQEKCGYDPIGFVRLRMAGPVAHVTLTWQP